MMNYYVSGSLYVHETISSQKKAIHLKIKERYIALEVKSLTEKPFFFWKADGAECKTSFYCIVSFQDGPSNLFLPFALVTNQNFHREDGS